MILWTFPGDPGIPRPLGTSIFLSMKQGQYLISGRWCHFSFQTAEKLHTPAGEILLKSILKCWPFAFTISSCLRNVFIEFKRNKEQRRGVVFTLLNFTAHRAFCHSEGWTIIPKKWEIPTITSPNHKSRGAPFPLDKLCTAQEHPRIPHLTFSWNKKFLFKVTRSRILTKMSLQPCTSCREINALFKVWGSGLAPSLRAAAQEKRGCRRKQGKVLLLHLKVKNPKSK